MGLIADEQPAIYRVLDTAGLSHGKAMQSYLCMMAVRLLELRRVLKDTGSIYLHCDPTASHYLKLLMDAVFGSGLFLKEMTWKRSSAHSDTKQGMRRAGKIRDVVLVYTKTADCVWNPQYMAYTDDYLQVEYRHVTPDGRRYKETDVTAAKPGGDTEYEWRVKRPTHEKTRWQADLADEHRTPRPGWEYKAANPYRGRYWAYSKSNLVSFWNEGRLIHRETGMPRLMQFADDMPGVPLQDLWDDIPPVLGNERVGYPTQKPLALLERIIRASSNEGDLVLDPFCGCATACVAAENLGRRWIGIDMSPKAVELVNVRLQSSMGSLFHNRLVTARTDVPRRADIDAPVPYRQNKHVLFGQQKGRCNGCKSAFEFSSSGGCPHHPSERRWPRPHRQPPTTLRSLQPCQGESPAGIPDRPAARVGYLSVTSRSVPWWGLKVGVMLVYSKTQHYIRRQKRECPLPGDPRLSPSPCPRRWRRRCAG